MATKIPCTLLFLAAGFFLPQNSLMAGSRAALPNAVDLELGGKCVLYSFSYQRMVAEPFGLEVGVSLLGESSSSGGTSSIVFFTFGGKLYIIQKGNMSPYIGAGIVTISTSADFGPFGDGGTGSYGYVSPGFEYRSDGGFLVRGGVYALISNGSFFVWPGLSVGLAF